MSAPARLPLPEDLPAQTETVDSEAPEVRARLAGLVLADPGAEGAVAAHAFPLLRQDAGAAAGQDRLQLLPRPAQHLLCLRLVRRGAEDESPAAAQPGSGQPRFGRRGADPIGALGGGELQRRCR